MKNINIGQKFGFLEVISLKTSMLTPKGKPSRAYVVCRCSCGKEKVIYRGRLFKGDAKTCGSKKCKAQSFILAWKKKDSYRHRKTSDGYIRVRINRKDFLAHRLIMEKHLGRKLGKDEIVHHLNGIKTDNGIENLEVLLNSDHTKSHAERLIEIALLKKLVYELQDKIKQLEQEKIKLIS